MDNQAAVVVIGGGPAGLSAGIVLAARNIPTVIFERYALPHDKACGEGIMPTGVRFLQRYHVDKAARPDQIYPFQGITYQAFGRSRATGRFRQGCGWGMARTALSEALYRTASQYVNLAIFPNTQPDVTLERDGRWMVRSGQRDFYPRLLIGADGRYSSIRRLAGIPEKPRTYLRWGIRQHFFARPWSPHVEIHWTNGLEAYITPCGPEMINLAVLWDPKRIKPPGPGIDLIMSFVQEFPELQGRLERAVPYDHPLAVGPLEHRVRSPVGEGILLMGDAAGYLDAITGEGLSLAFAQAEALERTVIPILIEDSSSTTTLSKRQLASYAAAYRRIIFPHLLITRLLLILSTRPRLAEAIINWLDRHPALFQHLLSLNMGILPWEEAASEQDGKVSKEKPGTTREH